MGLTLILLLAALVAVLAPFAEPVAEASGAPGSVGSVSLSRADGTVTASWGAVSGATRYHATYSTDGGGSWHAPVSGHRNITSTSITFGADNASTYIVGVRAGNDQGWGSWTNSSPAGPFVPPKRTPTPTPTPEPTPTPTPTPKPPAKPPTAPSVTAARGEDATTATVSWTKYTGDDFDYYRFVVCPAANFIGGTCSNNVFTSDAYYDASTTGPVKVTGLDASTGYGVILQVWRRGGAGALKPNTTIPAAAPSPTPTPTKPGRSLTFGSHTVADQSWTKDTAIDTLRLPAATVSTDGLVGITIVPAMTYTLTPALPAGTSFDATARTISGTPTAEAASATYTYTASADGYNSASLTFAIAVAKPALGFGGATVDDQSYIKDKAIDTLTLPAATGGGGTYTYSLSPTTLPEGLSFDATARTITGTPTALADSADYTYSATRRHGLRRAVLRHRGAPGAGRIRPVRPLLGHYSSTPELAAGRCRQRGHAGGHRRRPHRLLAGELGPEHQAGPAPGAVLERQHAHHQRDAHERLQQAGIRVQRRGHQQGHPLESQVPGGGHERELPAVREHQEQLGPAPRRSSGPTTTPTPE